MGLIEVIAYPKPPDYLPPVNWDKYRGCNHHRFEVTKEKTGYAFSFSSFIGKKLSEKMWKILVTTIRPTQLWIIREGESEWTIGRLDNYVNIYVDENDIVKNVVMGI